MAGLRTGPGGRTREALRATGLPLGGVPFGTHLCCFFRTRADLQHVASSFLKAGLDGEERCWWYTSPIEPAEAARALRQRLTPREVQEIHLLRGNPWYREDGILDEAHVMALWNERIGAALADGRSGVRWMDTIDLSVECFRRDYLIFEQQIDRLIAGWRMLVLCTYSLEDARAADIVQLADTHDLVFGWRDGSFVRLCERRLSNQREAMREPAAERLARVVRAHRLRQMLSQEELAARADLHATYVAGIERGTRNPSLLVLGKLASALGIGLEFLFHHEEE